MILPTAPLSQRSLAAGGGSQVRVWWCLRRGQQHAGRHAHAHARLPRTTCAHTRAGLHCAAADPLPPPPSPLAAAAAPSLPLQAQPRLPKAAVPAAAAARSNGRSKQLRRAQRAVVARAERSQGRSPPQRVSFDEEAEEGYDNTYSRLSTEEINAWDTRGPPTPLLGGCAGLLGGGGVGWGGECGLRGRSGRAGERAWRVQNTVGSHPARACCTPTSTPGPWAAPTHTTREQQGGGSLAV